MKRFAALFGLVAALALLLSSCKKDESGTFVLDKQALFLSKGATATLGFTASNVRSYTVSSTPEGWDDPLIDAASHTITVTAPSSVEDDAVATGSITFSATVNGGGTITATLFVGVVGTVDLTSKPANSYLINTMETRYLLDAAVRGDGSPLPTASVALIWQSQTSLIQYLDFADGKVSFYVDSDSDTGSIKQGNALLGAYDADGTLIWSWHLWAADYDPEAAGSTVSFNNYAMMTRNLGALAQSNDSTDEILASFGLYYQWGRKEPFIGPSSYLASSGSSAAMYDVSNSRVYLTDEASSAATGTAEYAAQHPLCYITGVAASENDWLWDARSNTLWSASEKTVNDPCPYGWRVAPAAAYAGLAIVGTPQAADSEAFAWTLRKDGAESLFFGAGRRRYDNSKIQNLYISLEGLDLAALKTRADEAQPWEGLYWTADTQGDDASAFHFWFEKKTTTGRVADAVPYARANGLSVRCVRAE